MHRHTLALALAALVAVSLAGCSVINRDNTTTRIGSAPYTIGSGKSATDVRPLGQFHAISGDNGVYVIVRRGADRTAKVTLDDNLLGMLKTTVENGILSIRIDGSIETHLRLEVTVTTPDALDSLAVANGSTLDIESIDATTLSATVGNGSTMRGGGRATTLSLTVVNGSTGDLRNVTAETATVNVTGGSTAHVNAKTSATGTCNGGSTTIVHGSPATRSIAADSSSTVKTE